MLNQTTADEMVDAGGRPYFLWDVEMSLDEFVEALRSGGDVERAYLIGKLMRQARHDDVFLFVTLGEIKLLWPMLEKYLGSSMGFWRWLVEAIEVSVMRREVAFCRMTVSRDEERILVDLVAEPAGAVVEPEEREVGGRRVLVAGLRELLASKLCTLLNRAEPRDLIDVRAIIAKGVSFEQALSDAPGIDSGFSALTLGWVLSELDLAPIAAHAGLSEEEAEELALFKDQLVDQLKRMARVELGEQET